VVGPLQPPEAHRELGAFIHGLEQRMRERLEELRRQGTGG
jgi:hypothetical protein